MRTPHFAKQLLTLAASFAPAACSDDTPPPRDPTVFNTNGVVTTSGPAQPGDPGGIEPESFGTRPESGGPASPLEGHCDRGDPSLTAKDPEACQKSCRGQNDQVPLGSKCSSAVEQCLARCAKLHMW
jgi:hypothetical protein